MFVVLKLKVLWGVSYLFLQSVSSIAVLVYSQRYTFFIIVQYAVFCFCQFLFPLSPYKSPALLACVTLPIIVVKI